MFDVYLRLSFWFLNWENVPEMSLLHCPCLCHLSRPSRPSEREAHWAASGDSAPFVGAAAEAQSPRLSATVCQAAPENDRPATDRHRPRPPHPAAEENWGGHVLTPTAAGDHQRLVLECAGRDKRTSREKWEEKRKRLYFQNHELWNEKMKPLCTGVL